MNSKTLIRKALSLCLIVAVYATYSMVALAGGEKIAGELVVSGKSSSVKVNGQDAETGRAMFSTSTIDTPDSTSAILNLGKLGRIQLAPNTTASISFNEKGISGELMSGKITVLGAADAVSINAGGKTVLLNAGESVGANGGTDDYRDSNGNCVDADNDGKKECDDAKVGAAWWLWAAIFGGAVAGIVIAATSDNNRVALGGGGTVVSPSR